MIRKLTLLLALVLALAVAGGSSALGAGALKGQPGDIDFQHVAVGDSVAFKDGDASTSPAAVP